jgi:hypothetical protein
MSPADPCRPPGCADNSSAGWPAWQMHSNEYLQLLLSRMRMIQNRNESANCTIGQPAVRGQSEQPTR